MDEDEKLSRLKHDTRRIMEAFLRSSLQVDSVDCAPIRADVDSVGSSGDGVMECDGIAHSRTTGPPPPPQSPPSSEIDDKAVDEVVRILKEVGDDLNINFRLTTSPSVTSYEDFRGAFQSLLGNNSERVTPELHGITMLGLFTRHILSQQSGERSVSFSEMTSYAVNCVYEFYGDWLLNTGSWEGVSKLTGEVLPGDPTD